MEAHLLRTGKYPPGKGKLHHRLAARYGQAATYGAKRRHEVAKPTQYVIHRYVSSVLKVPGIRIVAVRTSQQASRDKKDDAQAWAIVAR